MEFLVNQQLKLPVVATGLTTGLSSFSTTFLVNGSVVSVSPTFTEVGGGLYTVNFTPTTTGRWTVFAQGLVQGYFDVVTKTLQGSVSDLLDEALGSWSWNKTTGSLTLYKNDASVLGTYAVVDTVDTASRERLT